jgi:hypothetical protein
MSHCLARLARGSGFRSAHTFDMPGRIQRRRGCIGYEKVCLIWAIGCCNWGMEFLDSTAGGPLAMDNVDAVQAQSRFFST